MKMEIKSPTADVPHSAGAKSYLPDWQFQKASTGILLVITSWEMSSHWLWQTRSSCALWRESRGWAGAVTKSGPAAACSDFRPTQPSCLTLAQHRSNSSHAASGSQTSEIACWRLAESIIFLALFGGRGWEVKSVFLLWEDSQSN